MQDVHDISVFYQLTRFCLKSPDQTAAIDYPLIIRASAAVTELACLDPLIFYYSKSSGCVYATLIYFLS